MSETIALGTIVSGSLKDVWPSEASHFTPWLADNLRYLGEKIGTELAFESRETSVGDFSADIVAIDISTNRKVIIENQYGTSDHKHLGQIITYASGLNAGSVIWISESIRQEHRIAIDFLNQNLAASDTLRLYAFEASVIRIDDSKPAFVLNLVASPPINGPTPTSDGAASETKEKYRNFFQILIDNLREKYHFTNARLGQPQNWYSFSSENSKIFKYSVNFTNDDQFKSEVYIDCGDKSKNESILEYLEQRKISIETEFGEALSWERLENRRACRVATYFDATIDSDSERLAETTDWATSKLLKFKAVFPKYIMEALRSIDA